ncbi:unnamed protein product, partial [Prorocentrum cordatum]
EPGKFHVEAMAKRSAEEADKLDGVPLAKRARLSRAKLAPHSKRAALADEENGQSYAAKLEAFEVFTRTDGWGHINEADVGPGTCCRLRFLLKWKMQDRQKVANARALYQGSKHRDVAEGQLDRGAPTLSWLGRRAVMLWASLRKWRLFSADVKPAFLRAEGASARGLMLRASPTKGMREMLSHQIGQQPGQPLKMINPCFGDPRSPKLWRYRSDEVPEAIGFKNRSLEDCLLLSLRPGRVEDDPFDARSFEGQTYAVDGLIGEHVDDLIGCGEGATNEQGPIREAEQSLSTYSVTLKFEKYLHAVKLIAVVEHRRADPARALSPKEPANFRTLNGQLQRPAAQGVIIPAAAVSFRASATGPATVQDFLDANKDLRFLKAHADVGLHFEFDTAWSDLRVGSYTDANWTSRHDGSSQGGNAIFIGPADELNAGTPTPFVAMEWASKKLQRLCRSSLSAEAQAAASGADSLMWVKVSLAWNLHPDMELEEAMVYLEESPFITDAKCLYDASRSSTAGLGIMEKRTAIEVKIVNEQMTEIGVT